VFSSLRREALSLGWLGYQDEERLCDALVSKTFISWTSSDLKWEGGDLSGVLKLGCWMKL
jgi:hypothetical protein